MKEFIKYWYFSVNVGVYFYIDVYLNQDFPVAQTVKNLPVMQDTRVQSLGQEYPLEKGMAIYSSILAWRIPWTEKPGGLQFMGSQRVGPTEQLKHTPQSLPLCLLCLVNFVCLVNI